MKRTCDETLKAMVTLDDAGQVLGINHLVKFPAIEDHNQAAAVAYVRGIAEKFDITRESLLNPEQPVSFGDPWKQEVAYRFSEEKTLFDSTTYAYYQTCLNTPVWAAGGTVKLMQIIPFWRRYLPTRELEINDLESSAYLCYALKSVNLTIPRMIYIRLYTVGNVLANPLIGHSRELLFRFFQHVIF